MPPRKYLDPDRTQVNPKWLEWKHEQDDLQMAKMHSGQYESYHPEEVDKQIPEEGCWIRVIEVPHTELALRFELPEQSMWRARRVYLQSGRVGNARPQLAVINTPGGELSLWPHEYVIVPDISQWVGQEPDCIMHSLDGGRFITEEQEAQLFYLQSRGISRQDACLLLLNDLPGNCYFTMNQVYVDMFHGVGQPLWRHVALNRREGARGFTVRINVDA